MADAIIPFPVARRDVPFSTASQISRAWKRGDCVSFMGVRHKHIREGREARQAQDRANFDKTPTAALLLTLVAALPAQTKGALRDNLAASARATDGDMSFRSALAAVEGLI